MTIHVPLRSILVATNVADMEWLFPFACSLAEESGASLTVLHVLTPMHGLTVDLQGYPNYSPAPAVADLTAELEAFGARACASNLHCEFMVTEGNAPDGILALLGRVRPDLLVMGTKARRGIEKWLLGSVAETVLRSSLIPVVTVGPGARKMAASRRPINNILFAASLKTDSKENAKLVYAWAQRLHARLVLLHVMAEGARDEGGERPDPAEREQQLRSLLPPDAFRDDSVTVQVRTGRVSREILAEARGNFDLVVLGALRNPLTGRLTPEGVLYQVMAEAHCPVASLHSEHVHKRLQ